MEMTMDIGYEQILKLVRQLPYREKKRLNRELDKDLQIKKTEKKQKEQSLNEFQKFLLEGPVMSDEQFNDYQQLRTDFNRWITK